jgi:hypothetical protein
LIPRCLRRGSSFLFLTPMVWHRAKRDYQHRFVRIYFFCNSLSRLRNARYSLLSSLLM